MSSPSLRGCKAPEAIPQHSQPTDEHNGIASSSRHSMGLLAMTRIPRDCFAPLGLAMTGLVAL